MSLIRTEAPKGMGLKQKRAGINQSFLWPSQPSFFRRQSQLYLFTAELDGPVHTNGDSADNASSIQHVCHA